MTRTHTSGCYFCHALKRIYAPEERATAIEANVDWHRHVLADHADLAWTQDNEAQVRAFIESTQPTDPRCDYRVNGGRCVQLAGHGGIGHIVGDEPTDSHDPRCISLTDSEFNDVCDCRTLRMLDAHDAENHEPTAQDHADGSTT